tara:strand:+ start:1035 stop:1193 length:159 start_codon:yes stop_codon:yes gene_type:complete
MGQHEQGAHEVGHSVGTLEFCPVLGRQEATAHDLDVVRCGEVSERKNLVNII